MRLLSALGLLATYACACGLAYGGWSGAALVGAAVAAVVTLVVASLAYGLGRLRSRDPVAGWALSRSAAIWGVALLAALPLLAGRVGLAAPLPALAGYLAARRSLHASDVALLGVVAAVAVGLPFHRETWQALPLALVPVALVALALGLRESWDLGALHHAARARQSPLPDGAPAAPGQDGAVARASLAAWALVAAGLLVALGVAALRESTGSWREGSAAGLLILTVAALGGAAWVQRKA